MRRRLPALLLGVAMLATSAPAQALDPPTLDQATVGEQRHLPPDLEPSLEDASRVRPSAYEGGCHAEKGDRTPDPCVLGDQDGTFTVVLIGDSHAVQWLPAVEAIADSQGWKLYSMTKSACPLPDVPVTVRGARAPDCLPWRSSAFELIERLQPDLVVAASLGRIYRVPGAATPREQQREWREGWRRSLERLGDAARTVVLLGDTPMWQEDPVACLRRHRRDIGLCDTPRSIAVSASIEATERDAARDAGVGWVPTTDLVCRGDPCRAVEGRHLVLRDIQHMTVAWARSIGPRLLERLACDALPIAGTGVVATRDAPPGSPRSSYLPAPSSPVPSPALLPSSGPTASPAPSAAPPAPSSSPAVSCPR